MIFACILLLPLLNFLTNSLCGRFLGTKYIKFTTVWNFIWSCLLSWVLLFTILKTNTVIYLDFGTWFDIDFLLINWTFVFDPLSATMNAMVLTVSLVIHVYSFYYMSNDPHLIRFIAYLSLFVWFMLILINSYNLVQFFIGWEGVGICSYLLINFWATRLPANKAAIKALLVNRVGDIFFFLAILVIIKLFKTTDLSIIANLAPSLKHVTFFNSINAYLIICVCLLGGVMGKSAQYGLHTWLPSAMEGPTPVSALIHAATMVTAGIYLILRTSFLFEYCVYPILTCVFIVGVLTALFSADFATNQTDIKKIIAYSTCSQLGIMLMACGLSNYTFAFFHLINHGFFKALMFLLAGVIIHTFNEEQDIRRLGGLTVVLPVISCLFFVGSLSLSGFFFWGAFYSKEVIGDGIILLSNLSLGEVWFWVNALVMASSARYCFELEEMFDNEPEGLRINFMRSSPLPKDVFFCLIVLAGCSLLCGFFFLELVVNHQVDFFNNSLTHLTDTNSYFNSREYTSVSFKFVFLLFGDFEYFEFVRDDDPLDVTYSRNFNTMATTTKSFFYFYIDKGLIEYLGPYNLNRLYSFIIKKVMGLQFISLNTIFYVIIYCFFILVLF